MTFTIVLSVLFQILHFVTPSVVTLQKFENSDRTSSSILYAINFCTSITVSGYICMKEKLLGVLIY